MTRQRRWQLRKIAEGLCCVCGKKRETSARYCERHRAIDNERNKAKAKKKREAHAAGQ